MAEIAGRTVVPQSGPAQGALESDTDLIRACIDGETQAWERLVDKYERLVYSIPLGYGLSPDDASDITQQCFTSLFQRLGTLAEDSRLGAWLVTVAKRHTWRTMNRRSNGATNGSEVSTQDLSLIDREAVRFIERSELKEWLECGLSQLDEGCRELLVALYFDPRVGSYAQTAERLGIPVGSIGPMRARCLERLRVALDELSEDPARPARAAQADVDPSGDHTGPCREC